MCASAPGSQLRASFTGSTSVALAVDASSTATRAGALPIVAWSVDGGAWRSAWAAAPGGGAQQQLLLASGLNASASHTVRVVLDASGQSGDRWLFAPNNEFLCVAGLAVESGGAALAPALRPRRALVYGDSITEGVAALRMVFGADTAPTSSGWGCVAGGDAYVNSAIHSWAAHVADALDAEVSMAAFAAQGYVTRNSYGYGNIPPLLTPNDPAASAWQWVYNGSSRLPALTARPPDFVLIAEGFNDQVVAPAAQVITLRRQHQECSQN